MNEVLRSIVSSGSVTSEDAKTRTTHSAISREEGDFDQEMISSARPQVSVEVGCIYKISSLYQDVAQLGGEGLKVRSWRGCSPWSARTHHNSLRPAPPRQLRA
jgi:hypothetical protein